MPTVSILLTSYNYAQYIDATIDSVVTQRWTDWELLIIDDGSTDDSVARIQRWVARDARIRLLRHADNANHGLAASLHLGLQEASGPLVAFLESDDAWRADCLERRLQAFSRYDADVVFHPARPVPVGACAIGRIHRYMANLRRRFPRTGPIIPGQDIWLSNIVPSFSCAMVRRRLLACDWNTPEPAWLDWWVWFQLANQRARFVYLDAPLTRWRVHAGSYSASVTSVQARRKRMLRGCCAKADDCRPFWTRAALLLPAPFLVLLRTMLLLGWRLRRALV